MDVDKKVFRREEVYLTVSGNNVGVHKQEEQSLTCFS